MKLQNNRRLCTIALITVLAVSAIMASMQAATAAQVTETPTFAFLSASPNPVGINQETLLVAWLENMPLLTKPTSSPSVLFEGYTITVTKPDGTTQTLGPYTSDPIASIYLPYTPTQIGNYALQFSFPGQHCVGYLNTAGMNILIDTNYKPSVSAVVTLTVQQQAIPPYQDAPLPGPNDYWSRPLSGDNRGWYTIAGNWLAIPFARGNAYSTDGAFNPYSKAPNSAHIVWKKPLMPGA